MELNEMVERWINSYIKLYGMIQEKVNQRWPENSLRITDKIFQEMAKDIREGWLSFPFLGKNNEKKSNEPATEKQRMALHKFGIENIPDSLTKREAFEILEELIGLSQEGDREAIEEIVARINKEWQ